MRVEFAATIDDRLAAFWRANFSTARSRWKLKAACLLAVLGVWLVGTQLLWLIPDIAASNTAKKVSVGGAFVIALSFPFLVFWLIQFDQRRALRKTLHGAETFRVVMELSPRGVSLSDPTAQVLYDWPKIKGVTITGQTIDIVTFHGHTLWVPKRAFESPEEETLFVETVKAHLAEPSRTQGAGGSDHPATGRIQKG
jgi:hypothetical protein